MANDVDNIVNSKSLLSDQAAQLLKSDLVDFKSNDIKAIREYLLPLEDTNQLFLDPATVAMIMEVAAVVGKLLSGWLEKTRNDSLKKIAGELHKINAKLDIIDNKLANILNELAALKVSVQQAPIIDLRHELLALQQTIADNFNRWHSSNNATEPEGILISLQVLTRKLINYGYAQYLHVAYAISSEVQLSLLINRQFEYIKPSLDRYMAYFNECINAKIPGSFGKRFDEVSHRERTLKGKHDKITRPIYVDLYTKKRYTHTNDERCTIEEMHYRRDALSKRCIMLKL